MSSEENIPKLHPDWIDPHAYEIVKVLQQKGFISYLVGGCVRDLLLGKEPKDYDIGTMASPQKVKKHIPFSFIIGKRFRLVLVKRYSNQYEVATFRKHFTAGEKVDEMPDGDNVFGSPEEDATRRDFTINGLFYDPMDQELIDYTDGLNDLKSGVVRMIGDPDLRLVEDPIRILRAVRLAHMIDFKLEMDLRQAMAKHSATLDGAALPRVREEFLKFLRLKEPALPFLTCFDLGVFKYISPTLHKLMSDPEKQSLFLNYLNQFHGHTEEKPMLLFNRLIHAYIRTEIDPDGSADLKTKTLVEDEALSHFMLRELGLFKYEQKAICRAFQIQSSLHKSDSRKSKGRIHSLVSSESFPLALTLASIDKSCPPDIFEQWAADSKNVVSHSDTEPMPKRRRRRPRKKSKKPSSSNTVS